jgi:hypothetical protein
MARILGLVVIALGTAVAVWLTLEIWGRAGDAEISWQGWLAMGLGVVVTAGLGGGLMTLIFYSNRMGYDDRAGEAGHDPGSAEPPDAPDDGPPA